VLCDLGRAAEAEPLLRECFETRVKHLAPGERRIMSATGLLGACLARQAKFAEAEPLLLFGYKGLTKEKTAKPKEIARVLDRIIEHHDKWGKAEQAKEWRKKRDEQKGRQAKG
jgi:eukaryotic-like serine/threonine-protein kinase